MTVTKTTDLVTLISNQLGWAPPLDDNRPPWKVKATEASKLSRGIAKDPALYTFANLELAVEYMRRKHITPHSPLAVLTFVKPALKAANTVEVRPLGELVDEAIAYEYEQQAPGWEKWASRLTNAFGAYRQEVYDAWRADRRPA